MIPRPLGNVYTASLVFALLAVAQLFFFVRTEGVTGPWFLHGEDTIAHDAIVHIWVGQWAREAPGVIPLWINEIQGGIPALGAFAWTPFSPQAWPFLFLDYPAAHMSGWFLALWAAGIGAYILGRALRLRFGAALFLGMAWMLSGHVVTLIHAGHFQKVVALGWMPWCIAGAVMIADPHAAPRRARGMACLAAGLGLMFLGGHPQIAYASIGLAGLYGLYALTGRRLLRYAAGRHLLFLAGAIVLGLLFGAAQLLPGIEMSALSNRSDGVSFAEAVETSYPPGELMELVVPRWKGSSVRGDVYTGDWGQRIVSDYVGKIVLGLAMIALIGSGSRFNQVLFWLAMAAGSLIVGVGDATPVYRILYELLPGFSSFRSPGTFMCVAMLSFAVLAGYGVDLIERALRRGRGRKVYPLVFWIAFLGAVADLGIANRYFLYRESWNNYYGYLAPNQLDLWLIERDLYRQTHDVVSEMNLRPILYGGWAINGYHPVLYKIKEERDQALGFGTEEWFAAWGITHLLVPPNPEQAKEDPNLVAMFQDARRGIFNIPDATPPVRHVEVSDASLSWEWNSHTPNEKSLKLAGPPGLIAVSGIVGPGTELSVNGKWRETTDQPILSTTLSHEPGESVYTWKYRPQSYKAGLFLTAVGAMGIGFLLAFAATWRAPLWLSLRDEESIPET